MVLLTTFDSVAKYNDKLEAAGHRQPGGKPHGKRKGSVKYVGARLRPLPSDCEDNGCRSSYRDGNNG